MGAAGVEPVVVREPMTPEDAAYAGARLLLERDDRPTGILCHSDVMAHWVVRAAEDLGLTIPDDLSVVGFDDNPLARRLRPELTTVWQPIAEKGHVAAAELTAAIDSAQAGRPQPAEHVVLPTELVVRGAPARPRRADPAAPSRRGQCAPVATRSSRTARNSV